MADARDPARTPKTPLSRRHFLKSAGSVAAGGAIAHGVLAGSAAARANAAGESSGAELLEGEIEIELTINGAKQKLRCEPRTTLLNALRNHCEPALTGTKLVCDRGNCGACTVHVDGKPAYACLLLAADMRGRSIGTIEGLGTPEQLTPLQQSMWQHDGQMCGFCTPGFVMSISACLAKNPRADLEAIKQSCAGNLCRCGTYPHVFAAALALARGEGQPK